VKGTTQQDGTTISDNPEEQWGRELMITKCVCGMRVPASIDNFAATLARKHGDLRKI
jgi:hypothetical protein